MSDGPAIRERLARIEQDIVHLLDESRAIRTTLHSLVTTAMTDHSAAIRTLSSAHDQRIGLWISVAWISAVVVALLGGAAWLLENQVQIVIKPP